MKKFSENLYSPYPDESLHWPSIEGFASSKSYKLTRSRGCRAIVTKGSSSPFWQEYSNSNTPPSKFEKCFPGRPENTDGSTNDVQKEQCKYKAAAEENISSIHNFVEELKGRMAKLQCQKQLNDEQQEPVLDGIPNVLEDARNEKCVEVVPEAMQDPIEAPTIKFERQQIEIVELWDTCNVSLIHRSCFFLLFNGDPADSVYMEVELRRLSFLKNKYFQGNHDDNIAVTSSIKALRHERALLSKLMLKKLSTKSREELYKKWGISLVSKQRRVQLAKKVWTDTTDMNHVRESALLVAQLDGFQEPGMVLKEMFELSFTPQRSSKSLCHSSSWKPVYSMLHS